MRVYFGDFDSKESLVHNFSIAEEDLDNKDVLFASYKYEDYEGSAFVIYKDEEGKLFEVNGSHCSCNGLEGQWEPEETFIEALMKRDSNFFNDVVKAYISKQIIESALYDEASIKSKGVTLKKNKI